jgi:beta-lactamase regulating signal transducer with metallopeptidase domain
VTIGVWRPRIVLPPGWRAWESDKLRSVLLHELAHVHRRDPLGRLVVGLVPCVYWFHPLAWLLPRRAAELAEIAADAAALRSLPERRSYARHLVEIAGALESRRLSWASVPLVGSRELEARITAILGPAAPRAPRRRTLALVVALASLWLAAAMVRVVSRDPQPNTVEATWR